MGDDARAMGARMQRRESNMWRVFLTDQRLVVNGIPTSVFLDEVDREITIHIPSHFPYEAKEARLNDAVEDLAGLLGRRIFEVLPAIQRLAAGAGLSLHEHSGFTA